MTHIYYDVNAMHHMAQHMTQQGNDFESEVIQRLQDLDASLSNLPYSIDVPYDGVLAHFLTDTLTVLANLIAIRQALGQQLGNSATAMQNTDDATATSFHPSATQHEQRHSGVMAE